MMIKKIQLDYIDKNGFNSTSHDKICHIKTLPYLSIVQAVEGNYDIQLGEGEMHNTGDAGFFIAPSNIQQTIIHNADSTSKTIICRWVLLKIKINEIYSFDDLYDFPVIIPETHKKEMNLLFNRLFATDDLFDEYVCYYEMVKILSRLAKKKEQKNSPHLDKALNYIRYNYKDKINIQDIAKEISLSQSHLYSIFKKEMGRSPISYLNNYRLSLAADELLKTDKTITEIADMVGIHDSVYFNKMFRKAYQISPSEYRKIHKNGRE